MIAFEPKGTLQAFGEKLGFQVMPISREQAREILEAAYALAAAKSTDAPSVEQMIAQPDKGWMWVMPSARKSSSSTGEPTLTRVVVLGKAAIPAAHVEA